MLWNNLRYALRQFRQSPAFTITILVTLALTIGVNTAIYSVVDAIFFRPLPYPKPDRLVMIGVAYSKNGTSGIRTNQNGRLWEALRDHATLLDCAVYHPGSGGVNLFANGGVEYVKQQKVSAGFFNVLGISPLAGREFTRQEDVRGGPAVAILSYEFWQRVFQGNPSIIGRTVDLRGAPYTVVGIMPRGFHSDAKVDVWTPIQPSTTGEGGGWNYTVIGRLKPGVTPAAANAQLSVVTAPLLDEMRKNLPHNGSIDERTVPLQIGRADYLRTSITIMWAAAALVLLIGCVNIAGILLARSATRSREIATRMSVGASRRAVISQLLSEAALLAIGGGTGGLLVGKFAIAALTWLNPGEFDIWRPTQLDARVAGVMLAVSLATSVFFGLFPALEATSVDLRSSLSEAGRTASGSRKQWKRQALVLAEVALGVVLVVGAGLLIRTFATLMGTNPGFNPNHLMTATVSLQDARYSTSAAGARLFRETLEKIRRIPGVQSAAATLTLPYEQAVNENIQAISGRRITRYDGLTNIVYTTPGFFETLEMPVLRGRDFEDTDRATSAKICVVNRAFEEAYMPADSAPLGRQINFFGGEPCEIVGVVGDVPQQQGWGGNFGPIPALPQIYVPVDQVDNSGFVLVNTFTSPSFAVRTRGNIAGLEHPMSRAVQSVDPRLPFSAFRSISEVRSDALQEQRYHAVLFSTFAALAIFLSALGVYGLIAQSVAQRTREMGIRLALGATWRDVIRAAAMPGITLSLAGIAVGFVLAAFAARLLKSLIWGVTTTDPLTFLSVAVLLVTVAAISSLIPALRLVRLDPAQTLRQE
ncbi:MAG: ABC transporter permease [Bryobacteraceae bacterium]